MHAEERQLSRMLDQCVAQLDLLRRLTPENARRAGIDRVKARKAALERRLRDVRHHVA